jgi:hypothetical protein
VFRAGVGPSRDEVKENKLWWYPPGQPVIANQPSAPNLYFTRKLFLWMPYKFFNVLLYCVKPECQEIHLKTDAIHKRVWNVLDIDDYYYMATEALVCVHCKNLPYSNVILKQLDPGHIYQFPAIVTYRYIYLMSLFIKYSLLAFNLKQVWSLT